MRFRRSPAQIAASRRNGALSQGPVTPEGKRNVSQNAHKHGLYSKTILLPGESEAEFTRLADQLTARVCPRDVIESIYLQRMIVAQWRLLRVLNFEHAALLPDSDPDPNQHPVFIHLATFFDVHGQSRGSVLHLAETRFQRQFDIAVAKIAQLRGTPELRNFGTIPASYGKQTPTPENALPNNPLPATETDSLTAHPDPHATETEPHPNAQS